MWQCYYKADFQGVLKLCVNSVPTFPHGIKSSLISCDKEKTSWLSPQRRQDGYFFLQRVVVPPLKNISPRLRAETRGQELTADRDLPPLPPPHPHSVCMHHFLQAFGFIFYLFFSLKITTAAHSSVWAADLAAGTSVWIKLCWGPISF